MYSLQRNFKILLSFRSIPFRYLYMPMVISKQRNERKIFKLKDFDLSYCVKRYDIRGGIMGEGKTFVIDALRQTVFEILTTEMKKSNIPKACLILIFFTFYPPPPPLSSTHPHPRLVPVQVSHLKPQMKRISNILPSSTFNGEISGFALVPFRSANKNIPM